MTIVAGAMLSAAFNSDIANEIDDSSLSCNTAQVKDEKAKPKCPEESKLDSARWNYLMLAMLFAGYEGFTPEMEKYLNEKFKEKKI